MTVREIHSLLVVVAILFGLAGDAAAGGDPKQVPTDAVKLPPRAVARLGNLAFAQGQTINAIALTSDGTRAATADSGTVVEVQGKSQWNYDQIGIRLWEVPVGRVSRRIPVSEGPIVALDFSPDDKFLAAGAGKKVFIWDAATGKELQRIRLDDYPIQVRYTPDGKHLLINLYNKEILQWDLEKRTETVLWNSKTLDEGIYVRSLNLSMDGTRLGIVITKLPENDPNKPVLNHPPHRLQVLELPSGKQLFQADAKEISWCVALAPDKKTVAFGSERLALWDIAGNKKRQELAGVPVTPAPPPSVPLPAPFMAGPPKKWQTVGLLTYSPNGKLLVSTYNPGDVVIWNAETGAKIADFIHTFSRTPYHASDVLAFSRNSKLLALGGAEVLRLIDTTTGKEIAPWAGHRLPVSDIRYAPNGKTLFTRNEMDICAWDAKNGQPLQRHDLRPLQKKHVMATSLEKNLVVTWNQGDCLLEDLATGKLLTKLATKDKKFDAAEFSFQGEICCLNSYTSTGDVSAAFYSIPDGKELFQLKLVQPNGFGFAPVRNAFVWKDRDGNYIEADATNGKITKKLNIGIKPPDPDGPFVTMLATVYSWDGKFLLTQVYDDKAVQTIKIWDLDAGRLVRELQYPRSDFVGSIDFSYDSRLLVFWRFNRPGVSVLELASGKERRTLSVAGDLNPSRIATSPRDFTLAAGGPGNTVVIWDLARPTKTFTKAARTEKELDALWRDLADDNAIKAEDAIETLIQAPSQAAPFLKDRLKSVAPLERTLLEQLIAGLGSENFTAREKAIAELERKLELAEPALRQALEKGKPPLETRRRIEQILAKLPVPMDTATLQALRALEALEKIGTPEARAVIEQAARGAPSARVTQEAAAAVRRLDPPR
jgi:WD40 repeat protein